MAQLMLSVAKQVGLLPLPGTSAVDESCRAADSGLTGHMKKWVEAYNAKEAGDKERVLRLLRELTEGFVACTDAPPVHFVPELLEIYPDAKVILVTRDPQRWWLCFQWLMAMAATWFIPLLCAMSPRLQHYPSLHKAWRAILDKQVAIAGRAPGDYGPRR